MNCKKNFIGLNRELNRTNMKKKSVVSRQDNYNSIRGLKYDNPESGNLVESTVTSRELMLKKWKAQKELKKKEQDIKKPPAFVVRTASKIPSTVSVNKSSSLQNTSSSIKKTLPSKTYEKNIVNAPRLLSKKTNPKITTSTLTKTTLPSKKPEEKILNAPSSHKTIPKALKQPNVPTMKTSSTSNVVTTSVVKPSKLPEKNEVKFSNIPKTTFYKTVPRLFLFGNKNTEKAAVKSNSEKNKTKATNPVIHTSLLSCDVSHIESKMGNPTIENFEDTLCTKDTLSTPNPKIKLRTSTPLKETCMNMQKSPKNEEPDTLALLEDFSSTVHSCKSENNSTIIEKSDKKTPGTCSKKNKNTLLKEVQSSTITQSLNDQFQKLKVEELDLKSSKSEETQIDSIIIKDFESKTSSPMLLPSIKNLEIENLTPRRSERLKEKSKIYSSESLQSVEGPENKSVDTESCKKELLIDVTTDSKSQVQTPTWLLCTKILTTDNTTPRRSQRLKEKVGICSWENLQSVAKPSEIKLVDIESCKVENTQIENKIQNFERLKVKCERKDSFDDLLSMPRPSVMGLVDTDDSLESPSATATIVSYDFENLDYEDRMFEKKNEKNLKKVSLLYDPKRRQTRLTSIKGDLMSFSSPE